MIRMSGVVRVLDRVVGGVDVVLMCGVGGRWEIARGLCEVVCAQA